jgi:hypothetical protein
VGGLVPPFVAYPNFSSHSRNSRLYTPLSHTGEAPVPKEVFLAQGAMIYAPSENANPFNPHLPVFLSSLTMTAA